MSSSLSQPPLADRAKGPVLALLLVALLLGLALRTVGFSRGSSGLAADGHTGPQPDFHLFHPDELTLIRSALALRSPLDPPVTVYGLLPVYLAIPPWRSPPGYRAASSISRQPAIGAWPRSRCGHWRC